jgi:hypothetical protein
MEKANKWKEKILECPFCDSVVWFNFNESGKVQFKYHVLKEHLNMLVEYIINHQTKEVVKSKLKWCIK